MSASLRIASSSARSFFDISVTWAMNKEQASHHWNLKYKKSRLPHLLFSLLAAHLVEATSLGSSKAGCGWMSSAPKDGELEALKGLDKNEHSLWLKMSDLEFFKSSTQSWLAHFPTHIPPTSVPNSSTSPEKTSVNCVSSVEHWTPWNYGNPQIRRTLHPMRSWEPTNW